MRSHYDDTTGEYSANGRELEKRYSAANLSLADQEKKLQLGKFRLSAVGRFVGR